MFKIYFDIETNNLKGTSIIQIAAISQNNTHFNAFCTLKCNLSPTCTELTGFFTHGNKLFLNGRQVSTQPENIVLKNFVDWIEKQSSKPIYLVAHNSFNFDARILISHCNAFKIEISARIHFIDTLPLLKKLYTGPISNFQLKTIADFFKIPNILSHTALSDAITLKQVFDIIIDQHELSTPFIEGFSRTLSEFKSKK